MATMALCQRRIESRQPNLGPYVWGNVQWSTPQHVCIQFAPLYFSHQFSAVMVLEFSQFHGPLGPSFSPLVLVRCGDVGLELAYLCGSRGRHIYPCAVEVPFRLPCAQIARATDIRTVGMNATFDLRNASKWTFRGGRRFSRRGCD